MIPTVLPRPRTGPSRYQPSNATIHRVPVGPGWKDSAEGDRDGLDEMISGLKNGSIQENDKVDYIVGIDELMVPG